MSLYLKVDASCLPLTPRRSLWLRMQLEGGQDPWKKQRQPLLSLQFQTQCCSAKGPRHARQVPMNCDSGALLCL